MSLIVFSSYAENDRNTSIMFFFLDKSEDLQASNKALDEILSKESPDIAIFAGVKNRRFLDAIITRNPSYKYSFLGESGAPEHLGLISILEPSECKLLQKSYKIKNDISGVEEEVQISRGFLLAKFAIADYSFSILAAHLKDRSPHPDFNQFDMRRYEARQLRYSFDEIIKNAPDANVIIIGNFNDNCGMSPIKEIYARKYKNKKKLFDIRPIDDLRTSWTYWNQNSDEYERIFYAMTSLNMLSEIDRTKTKIVMNESWTKIFNNRPLLISLKANEMEEPSDSYVSAIYPNSIYSEIAAHFEKDKIIGEKPRRKSPKTAVEQKKE